MYKRTKYKAIVLPITVGGVPTTANATVVAGSPDVTLEGIDGADLNALENGDEFWVIGGEETGDYQIKLTCNSCSNAYDIDGEQAFKFELQEGPPASLYLDVASYGTYPNFQYNPSGGNYSQNPTTTFAREFWVDAVGGTYSGKVKLTATYKVFGLVHAQTKQSGYVGFPVGGISFGIPGLSARVTLPELSGGARAAAGIGLHVPRDGGYYEDIYSIWTDALSWPLLLSDEKGGYPKGPAESPALDNTFSGVGISAAKGLTMSTFVEVSVNSANLNKGQARVSGVSDEINNPVFSIVP